MLFGADIRVCNRDALLYERMTPAPKTISEKILSAKSGENAMAGDVVVCNVDYALGTDASVPMAIDYFNAMGGTGVRHPERLVFALDHYAPAPNRETARLHQRTREFARAHGIELWEVGDGIGHQLMVESDHVTEGSVVVGADSHAVTYGALNAFATGIGSSDLAAIFISGRVWLRVPESIRITIEGQLPRGVFAKDVALHLAKLLGADGATYVALEFAGRDLDLDTRLVLANMSVETGAKNAVFPAAVIADAGAAYVREILLDLSNVAPQVALPHQVDRVVGIEEAAGTPVGMVYLGTCTGGRVSDFHEARDVLKAGGGIAHGVQLVVTPASRAVFEMLSRDGTLSDFIAMGAVIQTPGCGSCCGTCGSIPGDGVNVISTANRNFKGRMGNSAANIYLASPASCAAAAVKGAISDPREYA
jgi:3-isopropylmalate/(R)-2-methylmalate dehydratase large subunit